MGSNPSFRQDPADLAATLRALATRAHEAVKAVEARRHAPSLDQLAELRDAVCVLEDEFRTQKLGSLLPYVASLRQQIEAKLG